MSQTTVQVPVETIDKLAALGKAMLSLADDLRKHAEPNVSQKLDIPIPDLTRPETIPEGDEWFWSDEWQAKERAANDDIQAGRVSQTFTDADDVIATLSRRV